MCHNLTDGLPETIAMTDHEFDTALIGSAFAIAAGRGWHAVSVAAAAREAGLPLDRARTRFGSSRAILLRFGRIADSHALSDILESGPTRERLFDILMRRFDALQQHRAGVLALLRDLPTDPISALLLAAATGRSMAWLLEAAGVPTDGVRGALATNGMVAVWLYTLRAWQTDDSADLSGTMAALDRALARAERAAGWLHGGGTPHAEAGPKPFPEPETGHNLTGTISGAGAVPPFDA
jgi:AcrR family transcriptional regulator